MISLIIDRDSSSNSDRISSLKKIFGALESPVNNIGVGSQHLIWEGIRIESLITNGCQNI